MYENEGKLNEVLKEISKFPPLVFAGETRTLKHMLGEVSEGKAFLFQGGDCAESFEEFHPDNIRDLFKVILQVSLILTVSSHLPIVKIGRVAGQFSKPRSSSTEVVNGKELPSYLGDNINGMKFDEQSRRPDPCKIIKILFTICLNIKFIKSIFSRGVCRFKQSSLMEYGLRK
jgi:3-deoxy-7-phosphoheptulonate synthase